MGEFNDAIDYIIDLCDKATTAKLMRELHTTQDGRTQQEAYDRTNNQNKGIGGQEKSDNPPKGRGGQIA